MEKVALIFPMERDITPMREILKDVAEIVYAPSKTEDEIIAACKDATVILSGSKPQISNKVIDSCPNLKLIAFMSIGFNAVDADYAGSKGIAVVNNPAYCTNEVADHAATLILTLCRRIREFDRSVQAGEWKYSLCPEVSRISECTIGLMGFGRIPRMVAKRLSGFEPTIIAYDPYLPADAGKEMGVELVSLDELYARSDYISCHMPLTAETKGMLGAEAFAKMKDGVCIVNTARGPIVDEAAILKAIEDGKVAYLATDVVADEMAPIAGYPINNNDRILITPHVAFYSQASDRDCGLFSVTAIRDYLAGDFAKCSIMNKGALAK